MVSRTWSAAYLSGLTPRHSGSHLKETATGVEGTFRVSGSAKRMKDLQAIFDSPPKVCPFLSLSLHAEADSE